MNLREFEAVQLEAGDVRSGEVRLRSGSRIKGGWLLNVTSHLVKITEANGQIWYVPVGEIEAIGPETISPTQTPGR